MIRRLIAQIFQTSFMPFVGVGGMGQRYKIEKSLRIRGAASAYLTRTPGTAGNRKVWTWSGWIKRGAIGSEQVIFASRAGGNDLLDLRFTPADRIRLLNFISNSASIDLTTSLAFRDPSSFYHIQLSVDTSAAVASDRIRLYVNGTLVTGFTTSTYPSLNADTWVNAAVPHNIGVENPSVYQFDGYVSEIHLIDGQALAPIFGGHNPESGQWEPKKYVGTYGVNGFYLNFIDGTSLTTLGNDKSGNSNHWTLNNVSLTSGATYDWMDDSPSNNFPTLNPLNAFNISLLNASLNVAGNTASYFARSTIATPKSGKWYCEVQVVNATNLIVGLASEKANNNSNLGQAAGEIGVYWNGQCLKTNVAQSGSWPAISIGDIIGIACDADAKTVSFYRNGSSIGSAVSYSDFNDAFIAVGTYLSGGQAAINFGQRPFSYSLLTGFKTLCTKNLKDDTFNVSGSFTGNASASGPFIWCNGTPETLTINGNAVTWGTHADKLANGFKLRTANAGYNAAGTNNWSATFLAPSRKSSFRNQRAKVN